MKHDLKKAASRFAIYGDYTDAEPYGSGHINDTYAVTFHQGGKPVRYLFQRINHDIFKDVPALMGNIAKTTRHVRGKLEAADIQDVSRRALTLIPTRDGGDYLLDADGLYWRVYLFIEQARTYDVIKSPAQAFEAAKAFGRFQVVMADFQGQRLHETIPGFHDTRSRLDALRQAIEADAFNRASAAQPEIDFVLSRESMVDVLLDLQAGGELPERVTHNDTKLNNVMIDDETSEGICVIDLDTVMPGLALYDFGDMVRTATNTGNEDERDLSGISSDLTMFEALVRGYLSAAGSMLNARETELLPFSGCLMTLEVGLRFLTDHLSGDTYFKIQREDHNLDRCRTQFQLVADMESKHDAMSATVQNILEGRFCPEGRT